MLETAIRVLCLCLALASAEMLHGIARVRFLVPRVGKQRAQQVSIITGTLLAFIVCLFIVPTVGVSGQASLLALGFFLAVFMASFDVAVGRFLMKRRWAIIVEDFDPRKGNYLLFGLLALCFIPYFVIAVAGQR